MFLRMPWRTVRAIIPPMKELPLSSTDRRSFLKISATTLATGSALHCQKQASGEIEIQVIDDLLAGHMVFNKPPVAWPDPVDCGLLVVGGGIAGLTAAVSALDREPIVCELGRSLGGSAGFGEYAGVSFAQGAHYELEQPAYYGSEVLQLLENLGLIHFDGVRNMWTYTDEQWLIDPETERRCFEHGYYRNGVLPDLVESRRFESLLAPFEGRMPLPTRLIEDDLRYLDGLSFTAWLKDQELPLLPDFKRALDYQMKDDYGAGADHVSALAGIHYYRCRPYYTGEVKTFSPPNGNGYFVDKLAARLSGDQLLRGHVVIGIKPENQSFLVDVIAVEGLEPKRFRARNVVYAGHKHGLRHVLPSESHLFGSNRYAPWLVMNLVLDGKLKGDVYWQNEILSEDPAILGFVNSAAQNSGQNKTVLTVYYCLPTQNRRSLESIHGDVESRVVSTLETVSRVLGQDIKPMTQKVFVKLHGHAMPIPSPGYLFRDANERRGYAGLTYAGVDNARLPLIYEALDSGIMAAELLDGL